jgi:hypothetical protein
MSELKSNTHLPSCVDDILLPCTQFFLYLLLNQHPYMHLVTDFHFFLLITYDIFAY